MRKDFLFVSYEEEKLNNIELTDTIKNILHNGSLIPHPKNELSFLYNNLEKIIKEMTFDEFDKLNSLSFKNMNSINKNDYEESKQAFYTLITIRCYEKNIFLISLMILSMHYLIRNMDYYQ